MWSEMSPCRQVTSSPLVSLQMPRDKIRRGMSNPSPPRTLDLSLIRQAPAVQHEAIIEIRQSTGFCCVILASLSAWLSLSRSQQQPCGTKAKVVTPLSPETPVLLPGVKLQWLNFKFLDGKPSLGTHSDFPECRESLNQLCGVGSWRGGGVISTHQRHGRLPPPV